jgi:hypothetical protein
VACEGGHSTGPDGSPITGGDAGVDIDSAPTADADLTPDANEVVPDGSVPVDGGDVDIAATCAALCAKAVDCMGLEDSPECVSECTMELGYMCTPDEIAQLASCAALDCGGFESCVYSVPCMAQEEFCGNGICEEYSEDCSSCPDDCGACVCGDGVCSPGECATCESDCPDGCYCGDPCKPGPAHDPSCGSCDAEVCAADPYCCEVEWDGVCVDEAESICGKDCPSFCGDWVCDPGEDEENCPQDCGGIDPDWDGGVPPPPEPYADAGV